MPIEKIKARKIFDSNGEPTLEIDLITDFGLLRSSVPYTPLSNPNEAVNFRDNDDSASLGRTIVKAVNNINTIIGPELVKSRLEVCQQRDIDLLMKGLDDTDNKSKLGANAILGVSMACCRAGAIKRGIPLYKYISHLAGTQPIIPVPVFNMISGGKFAGNPLTYQHFMIMPIAAKSFGEAMTMGIDVYKAVEKQIADNAELKLPLTTGDDGSFHPDFEENTEALTTIVDAIKAAGYDGKVKIALSVSASTFCKDDLYDMEYKTEDTDPDDYLEPEALNEQYIELLTEFPQIISLEDPFDQEDWDSWQLLSDQPIQIVADDLTVMNSERVEEAIEKGVANCLAIRLSQAGTITEAIDCFKLARSAGWATIVCTGYGETEDNFVVDFAVGLAAGQLKAGAPCRGERISKYNQVLRIEQELGKQGRYVGEMFRNPLNLTEDVDDNNKNSKKKSKIKKKKRKKSL